MPCLRLIVVLACVAPAAGCATAAADNLPPAPVIGSVPSRRPPPVIAPPSAATVSEEFARRVSDSWCLPSVNGNSISNTFSPDLSGLADLNALANLGGFDHFNIEQDISEISQSDFPTRLPRWTGVDPALGGNTFYQFDDDYPWYYEEVSAAGAWMPRYSDPAIYTFNASGGPNALLWRDAPNIGPQNAGLTLSFTDYLVGVYPDHSGVRISDAFPNARNVNFQWTFTQGRWGSSRRELMRFSGFDRLEPGSEGSVGFVSFFARDPGQVSPTPGNDCQAPAAPKPSRYRPTRHSS